MTSSLIRGRPRRATAHISVRVLHTLLGGLAGVVWLVLPWMTISSDVPVPVTRAHQAAGSAAAPEQDGTSAVDLVLPLVVVGAAVVVAGYGYVRRTRRARTRTTPGGTAAPARPTAPVLSELDEHVRALLVEADDCVRTSREELGFAKARSGDKEVAPFVRAVRDAESELSAAFRMRQQYDDGVPDDATSRRHALAGMVGRCQEAGRLLDAEATAFDRLRALGPAPEAPSSTRRAGRAPTATAAPPREPSGAGSSAGQADVAAGAGQRLDAEATGFDRPRALEPAPEAPPSTPRAGREPGGAGSNAGEADVAAGAGDRTAEGRPVTGGRIGASPTTQHGGPPTRAHPSVEEHAPGVAGQAGPPTQAPGAADGLGEALAVAEDRFRALAARTGGAEVTLAGLGRRYGSSAVDAVTGHVEQAKDRLVFATTRLNQARQTADMGEGEDAARHLRAAEGAIAQADAFVAGIERLAADLASAAELVPAALTGAEAELAGARTARTGAGDVPAGELHARAVHADLVLAAVREGLTAGPYDPLDALRRIVQGLAPVAVGRAGVLSAAASLVARSAVADAGVFVTTHRGAVGSTARTRLAEAGRLLAAEPPELLAADALARRARELAEQDVRVHGNPIAGAAEHESGVAGAVQGGVLLASGSPASYGGPDTRARRAESLD